MDPKKKSNESSSSKEREITKAMLLAAMGFLTVNLGGTALFQTAAAQNGNSACPEGFEKVRNTCVQAATVIPKKRVKPDRI